MSKKSESVRKLIRELELGKKKLRLEYNRGIRAIDDAIATLLKLEMDAAALVKSVNPKSAGRPSKENVNLVNLVASKSGRRGRQVVEAGSRKQTLTQLVFDTVQGKKKFVHQREIAATVLKKFPDEDAVEFAKKISVLLAALKRRNKLVTVNQGGYRRNIFWGLPEWKSADGKILKNSEVKAERAGKKSVKR
jgi:hypothetical protein